MRLNETDAMILARAVHLHQRQASHLLLSDLVARISHEHYDCFGADSTQETMDACEASQDAIDEAMLTDRRSYVAYEVDAGKKAVLDLAASVLEYAG